MLKQGRNKASILCQIKKAFQRYSEIFSSKFGETYDKITLLNEIILLSLLQISFTYSFISFIFIAINF